MESTSQPIEVEVEDQLSKKFIEEEIKKLNIKIDENKINLIEQISFKNWLFHNELERLVSKTEELSQQIFALTIKSDNERKKIGSRINTMNKKIDDEIKKVYATVLETN